MGFALRWKTTPTAASGASRTLLDIVGLRTRVQFHIAQLNLFQSGEEKQSQSMTRLPSMESHSSASRHPNPTEVLVHKKFPNRATSYPYCTNIQQLCSNKELEMPTSEFSEYQPKTPTSENFPKRNELAALNGNVPKFSARLINGRYVVGVTAEEHREHYRDCCTLVADLIAY